MEKKKQVISVYVQGVENYYSTDKIEYASVPWYTEEVVKLTCPEERHDNGFYEEPDTCGIVGNVYIPKDKITQIVFFN